ncbi:hypothetical protein CCR78_06735 [Rhodovulum imhoffii]|nr:hypothetical protein [Rhodovulum imhoffii]
MADPFSGLQGGYIHPAHRPETTFIAGHTRSIRPRHSRAGNQERFVFQHLLSGDAAQRVMRTPEDIPSACDPAAAIKP